ncbi:unnamed protein product, partial [Staurois parvus]
LHLAQCSQASTILLATTKPRHTHRFARQIRVICHSREHLLGCSCSAHLVAELLSFSVASTLL